MIDKERIDKINVLIKKISPLSSERIYLKAMLHFLKKDLLKEYNEQKSQKINDMEEELSLINEKLDKLFEELKKLQILYFVQYEGELMNLNRTSYWETQHEYFYFKTDLNIDTFQNGWELYKNDSKIQLLIAEIHSFLYRQRFTNFNIVNIKNITI